MSAVFSTQRFGEPERSWLISNEDRNYLTWFHAQDWRKYTRAMQRYHHVQYCKITRQDPLAPIEKRWSPEHIERARSQGLWAS